MVWSLSGCDGIGVARNKREVCTAALKCETGVIRDDARTEMVEDAVDEGDSVAVLVGYGEVDGIAVVVGRRTFVKDFVGGFLGIKELCAFGEVGLGEELSKGDIAVRGV